MEGEGNFGALELGYIRYSITSYFVKTNILIVEMKDVRRQPIIIRRRRNGSV